MKRFQLSSKEEQRLEYLAQALQIEIRKPELYLIALTHRSYINKLKQLNRDPYSYEKLEFLGDAILQFVVTKFLFKRFKNSNEGELSALRAFLVKEVTLAKAVKQLNISRFIYTGKSFKEKVHNSEHVLSDVFESLVAAIYLDHGIKQTEQFVKKTLLNLFNLPNILSRKLYIDAKTQLQELIQKSLSITPVYETKRVLVGGVEKFLSYVKINNKPVAKAYGDTKLEAEVSAAQKTLKLANKIISNVNVKNKINKVG